MDHMSYYNEVWQEAVPVAFQAAFYEQNMSERICAAGASCPKPLLVERTEDGELTVCAAASFFCEVLEV